MRIEEKSSFLSEGVKLMAMVDDSIKSVEFLGNQTSIALGVLDSSRISESHSISWINPQPSEPNLKSN